MTFSVKSHMQKMAWKTAIEQQIEKYCPTDLGGGELLACGSPGCVFNFIFIIIIIPSFNLISMYWRINT